MQGWEVFVFFFFPEEAGPLGTGIPKSAPRGFPLI